MFIKLNGSIEEDSGNGETEHWRIAGSIPARHPCTTNSSRLGAPAVVLTQPVRRNRGVSLHTTTQ